MASTELVHIVGEEHPRPLPVAASLAPEELVAQVQTIQQVMAKVMQADTHYGVIPGTNKPSLLKPGAEKLMLTFRLCPEFRRDYRRDGDHLTIISYCTIRHIPTGQVFASDVAGSCSTRESKYAYRQGERVCPDCGGAFIIKGKKEYGGGWLCYGKKGGCGAKFQDGDQQIEGQQIGRVANPDLADVENTVLKMADKRALVAATLIATGASDIFTQDLEDLPGVETPGAAGGAASSSSTAAAPEATPGEPAETDPDDVPISAPTRKLLDAQAAALDLDFDTEAQRVLGREDVTSLSVGEAKLVSEDLSRIGEQRTLGAAA